ncbi:MAG TPA: LLM class flavin-dependent oxidoreductase [Candidatus Methylomirabilis sp.]|nr:LLM class flavin-dependent oxidoreductase [Candidatus Methylomirabilis sp.]
MDFGIGIASGVDGWKVAQRAEALGFTHAWFYDTQMLCADVFVSMALAAVKTSRIRLGTGVLVPANRIAPAAANGFATLRKLAPDRIDFGVGTGFTARNTMGLAAMRLGDMREYIRVVRQLLAGQLVEWEAEGAPRKVRFLDPASGLLAVGGDIPLHVSAFGPRARALTAEIADGWLAFVGRPSRAQRDIRAMEESCRAVGRDPATLYKTAFTMGCVLDAGESADSSRARIEAGPLALSFFHGVMDGTLRARIPEALAPAVADYRRLYESFEPSDARYLTLHKGHFIKPRPEEERFLTASLIRDLTTTGIADELVDRVRDLAASGYQQLAICLAPSREDAIDRWARVLDRV